MKIRIDREVLLHFAPYPILLVLGRKDPVLNYEESIVQVDNTSVQLISFEDGHMSTIENRDQLLAVLEDFMRKI
jgi:pimeloyl-ACP methyl ester carboxylesterase